MLNRILKIKAMSLIMMWKSPLKKQLEQQVYRLGK